MVEFLINNGVNINTEVKYGGLYSTPLFAASKEGHLAIVEFLIAKGANVNQKITDAPLPLTIAKKKRFTEVVEFLIKKDAKDGY